MRIAARTEYSGVLPLALADTFRRAAVRAHESLGSSGISGGSGTSGGSGSGGSDGAGPGLLERLRPAVRESWQRSLQHHGNPDVSHAELVFETAALIDYRDAHPLAAVMPVIQRLLVEPATDSGLLIAVADELGRLLWVDGDQDLRRRAEGMLFLEGAEWSERTVGTSAPGTALATSAETQIAGPEHFSRQVHPWNCTAVPLRDPSSGAVLGVVDVTGGPDAVAPHTLALVRAAVAAAESMLEIHRLHQYLDARTGTVPPGVTPGSTAPRDTEPGSAASGRITSGRTTSEGAAPARTSWRDASEGRTAAPAFSVRSTPARTPVPAPAPLLRVLGRDHAELAVTGETGVLTVELSARHSELLTVLALHPEGLTTGDLGLLAYPEDTRPGTVRAEMLRLRNLMASLSGRSGNTALIPSSRPYRLPAPIRLDALEVLENVERGAHRVGLAQYRGPVLPRSEAPAVWLLRNKVSSVLREAVMADAGTDTLLRYLQLPEAANDAEAWRLALRLLPARSPRRALVVTALERIERELA